MISEDIAGQAVTMAQKSLEAAVELAKIAKMIIGLPFKGIGKLIEFDAERKRQAVELVKVLGKDALSEEETSLNGGEVKLTELKKTGSIAMQTNISAKDIAIITEKAKAYDVPVAFIGKGKEAENVTLAFNTADKAAINQILSEVMNEKLAAKPNDYLTFQTDTLGEAQTISAMLKENDIPADITKTAQGKYVCVYEAKNAEALKLIKADFKEAHEKISKAFDITAAADGKKYTLSDLLAGKTITLGSLPTKEKLMRICREQFGFDNCQAMEAAHKFEIALTGQKLEYFRTDTRQAALLNNFERGVRLSDDNVLVKPYSFTRANFASDNVNRYFVSSGEKAAALIPDKMSREEMRETVRNRLGISDPETVKALVEKAEKIEVANKISDIKREARLSQKSGDIGIERLTNNYAEISKSGVTKRYDLRDKAAMLTALKADFGISQGKAENIFAKAKRQSPLANDLHKLREQSKTAAPKTKPVVDKKTSKGARL